MPAALITALPKIVDGASKVASIADSAMRVNEAIRDTKDTFSQLNNQQVENMRTTGEMSATQGTSTPPVFF